jgi:hypothetical protein
MLEWKRSFVYLLLTAVEPKPGLLVPAAPVHEFVHVLLLPYFLLTLGYITLGIVRIETPDPLPLDRDNMYLPTATVKSPDGTDIVMKATVGIPFREVFLGGCGHLRALVLFGVLLRVGLVLRVPPQHDLSDSFQVHYFAGVALHCHRLRAQVVFGLGQRRVRAARAFLEGAWEVVVQVAAAVLLLDLCEDCVFLLEQVVDVGLSPLEAHDVPVELSGALLVGPDILVVHLLPNIMR